MILEKVKVEFDNYVSNYDMKVKEYKIKYYHSYKVMELMKELALKLELSDEDILISQIIGLLHDIGRYEQFDKYHTFSDINSIDHADKSVDYLFGKQHIRQFLTTDKYDKYIKSAIKNHNKKEIDKSITDEKELMFCKMIRDCDKIDIYRVQAVDFDSTFKAEEVSEEVLMEFKESGIIDKQNRKSKSDSLILMLGFIFDFNYNESFDLLVETDNFDLFLGSINVDSNSEKLWRKLKEICFDKINLGIED